MPTVTIARTIRFGLPLAALLAAYWWGRRAGIRRGALLAGLEGELLGDGGDAGPLIGEAVTADDLDFSGSGISAVDYAIDVPRLGLLAAKQVAAAGARSWLTDYRKAQGVARFMSAPAYNTEAYYHAAFWTAVAARLTRNMGLAARAAALQAKGSALFAVPGSSLMRGSVQAILQSAASEIQDVPHLTGRVAPILAVLRQTGSDDRIERARQQAKDRSWITQGAAASARDLRQIAGYPTDWVGGVNLKVLEGLRAALGLPRPDKTPYPWWARWGARIGIGASAFLIYRISTSGWRSLIPSRVPTPATPSVVQQIVGAIDASRTRARRAAAAVQRRAQQSAAVPPPPPPVQGAVPVLATP